MEPDPEPDLLELAPETPGDRRFLALNMLPSAGMKATIASKIYEHPRATFGVRGPNGKSLAVDLDLAEPVKDKDGNLQQDVTLVLNAKIASKLRKVPKEQRAPGCVLLLGPLGDIEPAGA